MNDDLSVKSSGINVQLCILASIDICEIVEERRVECTNRSIIGTRDHENGVKRAKGPFDLRGCQFQQASQMRARHGVEKDENTANDEAKMAKDVGIVRSNVDIRLIENPRIQLIDTCLAFVNA